jgi:hypothetical protein
MSDLYHYLFATDLYTGPEILIYWVGFFLWAYAYVLLVISMRKYKYVEMPFIVASGNIAWEALWAFGFTPDMGPLLAWLYKAGFLVDCYIFYYLWKYGYKQISETPLKWFQPMLAWITVAWLGIFYLYYTEGWDNGLGTFSALQLNLVISPLCIMLLRRSKSVETFSLPVGWLKMLGTGLVTVFMFMHYPEKHFLQWVGIIIFVVDNTYIYMLSARKRAEAAGKYADTPEAQVSPAIAG